jgi:hypothetical protein
LPNEAASLNPSQELALPTVTDNTEEMVVTLEGANIEKSVDTEEGEIVEGDDNITAKDSFKMSVQDILSRNPINPAVEPPPEVQYLEDLVYYRYGFFLDDGVPYERPQEFRITLKDWSSVCRSVGGQHLDLSSRKSRPPITDFVNILANVRNPFNQVPSKYWDLSLDNPGFLSQEPTHFRIEVKDFTSGVLCLLHPRGLESSRCPAWVVAVPPMTALECIRRGFGPDPYVLVEYLTAHGMEFRTLQRLASRPRSKSPDDSDSSPTLGNRSLGHKFDSADFATYLTTRDTYLENHSHTRRALSIGGLVARLAREVLPVSAILTGPSQDALEGNQDVLFSGDEIYVDDGLSWEAGHMICGAYRQATATRSMSFI